MLLGNAALGIKQGESELEKFWKTSIETWDFSSSILGSFQLCEGLLAILLIIHLQLKFYVCLYVNSYRDEHATCVPKTSEIEIL